MASIWNRAISLSIFGESHAKAIGVVIDRLPAGEPIDLDRVQRMMQRRAPNAGKVGSTARTEADTPQILSGLLHGKTTGTPLCAVIANSDQRSADYQSLQHLARPGHADYTGFLRYHGFADARGGGHFSGRLTAPVVFAGAVCAQILEHRNIFTAAHIQSIMDVHDQAFETVSPNVAQMQAIAHKDFPVLDDDSGEKMRRVIEDAKRKQDSVGGIIECMTVGMPAGVGSPMFEGIENDIASMIFGIPAVRGIEFGAGFSASRMTGSEHNDPFCTDGGAVKTTSNHHGGVLGGITSGMPIVFRVCIKPTPSISRPQQTINCRTNQPETIEIKGRHDACIVPRAVVVVEAACSVALLSQLIECKRW